jgi:hypothetical protein
MNTFFSTESRKAWIAGAIALLGSLAVGATDNVITLAEWIAALSATVVALGAVYGVRNADTK